jgi:hypothetical protein
MSSETTLSQESIRALSAQLLNDINGLLLQESPESPLSEILHYHLDLALQAKEAAERKKRHKDWTLHMMQERNRPPEPTPAYIKYRLFRNESRSLSCPFCGQAILLPELPEDANYDAIKLPCHCSNGKDLVLSFLKGGWVNPQE